MKNTKIEWFHNTFNPWWGLSTTMKPSIDLRRIPVVLEAVDALNKHPRLQEIVG
jgi:hypothetical protein